MPTIICDFGVKPFNRLDLFVRIKEEGLICNLVKNVGIKVITCQSSCLYGPGAEVRLSP